jgi:hypothetical protein
MQEQLSPTEYLCMATSPSRTDVPVLTDAILSSFLGVGSLLRIWCIVERVVTSYLRSHMDALRGIASCNVEYLIAALLVETKVQNTNFYVCDVIGSPLQCFYGVCATLRKVTTGGFSCTNNAFPAEMLSITWNSRGGT